MKEQAEEGKEQIETNDNVQKEKELEEKQSLEALILQVVSISHEIELEPLTFINFLTLVRKVIPNDKIITEKQFLIDEILDMAKDKVVLFDKKINAFLKAQTGNKIAQGKTLTIAHLEDQMLSSFAETLATSTIYMNEEINENSLFILLNSGFQQLQQAAYFMLTHLYRNFIPRILFKKDEEEEIKQLQLMAEGQLESPEEDDGDREIRAKSKIEFKNVPQVLIDLVENPPSIEEPESDDEADMQTQIESLVFGDTKEGCISKKVFGFLATFCLGAASSKRSTMVE